MSSITAIAEPKSSAPARSRDRRSPGAKASAHSRTFWTRRSNWRAASDGAALVQILDLGLRPQLVRQRGRQELVDVAVQHALRVRGLHAGAQVLHHLVGLQHIAADLPAPADLGLLV